MAFKGNTEYESVKVGNIPDAFYLHPTCLWHFAQDIPTVHQATYITGVTPTLTPNINFIHSVTLVK